MTFWDFYHHYYVDDNPPVITSRTDGALVRHGGSMTRSAFWAGFDGLNRGIYNNPNPNTASGSAYRAGRAYRRDVNAGRRPALPDASKGITT